jgi:hypothetical protein
MEGFNMLDSVIGRYILAKYRARVDVSDVQTVARQLRKQGFPVELAVSILATRGGTV